jgi:hypothetical protein
MHSAEHEKVAKRARWKVMLLMFGFVLCVGAFVMWSSTHHIDTKHTSNILLLFVAAFVVCYFWIGFSNRKRFKPIFEQATPEQKLAIEIGRRDRLRSAISSAKILILLICAGWPFSLWRARHEMKLFGAIAVGCLVLGGFFVLWLQSLRKSLQKIDDRIAKTTMGETA